MHTGPTDIVVVHVQRGISQLYAHCEMVVVVDGMEAERSSLIACPYHYSSSGSSPYPNPPFPSPALLLPSL